MISGPREREIRTSASFFDPHIHREMKYTKWPSLMNLTFSRKIPALKSPVLYSYIYAALKSKHFLKQVKVNTKTSRRASGTIDRKSFPYILIWSSFHM